MGELDENWLAIELEECSAEFAAWRGGVRESFDSLSLPMPHRPEGNTAGTDGNESPGGIARPGHHLIERSR